MARPRASSLRLPSAALLLAAPVAALAARVQPAFADRLPAPLLVEGPAGLRWWQWLALPLAAAAVWTLGAVLGWATRLVLGRLAARTEVRWDDELLARLARPTTSLWAVGVAWAIVPVLGFSEAADLRLERWLRSAALLILFWGLARAVGVAFRAASRAPWAAQNAGLAGLLPLGRKLTKVALVGFGLAAVLSELGFQVASLLAGLGIGGLALALAAQKTVEHLFGSIAIGVDQPFRVGDFVNIEGTVGTVEAVGMRSTRLRTLDRTLVSYPNGRLAEMRLESFAARDRIRLHANLGLAYSTTAEQMRRVLAEVEAALRAHPKIWPDAVVVRFNDYKDSTLNVEVMAWFLTTDWNEFTAIRQELFLAFMEIVERAGTSFAFPTRTVHLVRE